MADPGLTATGADWKQQINRWDRYHYIRVAVVITAFALLVAALTGARGGRSAAGPVLD